MRLIAARWNEDSGVPCLRRLGAVNGLPRCIQEKRMTAQFKKQRKALDLSFSQHRGAKPKNLGWGTGMGQMAVVLDLSAAASLSECTYMLKQECARLKLRRRAFQQLVTEKLQVSELKEIPLN